MSSLRLVPPTGQPIELTSDQGTVGRDPGCEIVVTDGSVSRRHARLENRGAAWWVVDLGSANGTYVNSQKIAEQALKNGQELRFGALAFRVDLTEDPEATVATPILGENDSATLMAAAQPPAMPPPLPPPAAVKPLAPPPLPRPSPPSAPSAAAARERFKPAGAPASPVAQMPSGAVPAKKGRSPLFWILGGCCGCLLLVGVLIAVIGGGAYMATKPAADAAQTWLAEVRQDKLDAAAVGLSSEYRGRLSQEQLDAILATVKASKDATFLQRKIDNDRAVLSGMLSGGGAPQPIVIQLVKEGGAWKVDDVRLGVE